MVFQPTTVSSSNAFCTFITSPCLERSAFLIHDDTCWCHFTAGQKLQLPLSVLSHVLLHFLHHLIQPLLFVFSHCPSPSLAMVGIFPASVHMSALFLHAFTQTLACTNTHVHYTYIFSSQICPASGALHLHLSNSSFLLMDLHFLPVSAIYSLFSHRTM